MAQPKRAAAAKNSNKSTKKQANAKQALKKKHQFANKSRNDDLREKLDREASSLLNLQTLSDPRQTQVQQPNIMDVSVNNLASIMNSL